MNVYQEHLQIATLYLGREVASFAGKLDLPECIVANIRSIIEAYNKISEDQVWSNVVIELYANLLFSLRGHSERIQLMEYVDSGDNGTRLARMAMLLWITPELAPELLSKLIETPEVWLEVSPGAEGTKFANAVRESLHELINQMSHYRDNINVALNEAVNEFDENRPLFFF